MVTKITFSKLGCIPGGVETRYYRSVDVPALLKEFANSRKYWFTVDHGIPVTITVEQIEGEIGEE